MTRLRVISKRIASRPQILYHFSPKINRVSILNKGILSKFDQTLPDDDDPMLARGVFLTDKPRSGNLDCWEVDTRDLEIEPDWSSPGPDDDPEENWYVYYGDIPPERLRLLK